LTKIGIYLLKTSPHFYFDFSLVTIFSQPVLLQIRQVLKACHHLKSTPSWNATQHDATSENSKTFSLKAPKFLKCFFKKEWLVSNNWGLNSPFFFAKNCQKGTQFSENEIFFDKFPVFWKNNRLQETNFFLGGAGRVSSHLCILLTVLRVP
jgi:hypothetical protein